MLSLELVFVGFFLWRSLLEPEEVRAYPQALLILMGLCALVSLAYAWKLRGAASAPSGENRFNKYYSIGSFTAYLLAFHQLGFIVSTFLFYSLWMSVISRKFRISHPVIALITAAGLYYVFHDVLGVLLPAGVLEGIIG